MAKQESKQLEKPEVTRFPASFGDAERWFEEFFRRPFSMMRFPRWASSEMGELSPNVDIFEDKSEVVIKAELPGMKKEDIDITLTEDSITISGEKKKEEQIDKKDYHRWECSYGSFTRSFSLPAEVQNDRAKAEFKDGVLQIRIPKTEAAMKKGKKVKID